MGKAHRFQPALIDRAIEGGRSVMAEYGLLPGAPVSWPGWVRVTGVPTEKTWLRADEGGLVDMEWGPSPYVREGERICTVSDHFGEVHRTVTAPFAGLIVGVLENPVALPGHPLCHLVRVDETTQAEIERQLSTGEFDGYRANGLRWMGDGEAAD